MKKFRSYIIIVLAITSLLLMKFIFIPSEKKAGNKEKTKSATPVSIFVIANKSTEDKFTTSGTILANEETELKTETNGTITYLNLPEGKPVHRGTLLLKVNDDDLRAQLSKINVQLKLASDAESRQRKLLQISGISQQEYEVSLAQLQSLKADSAYQEAQIRKTEIRAPFYGVIGIKQVSIGAYITPSTAIASIHQTDPVKIDFTIPEKYSVFVKTGDQVSFKTEGSTKIYTAIIAVKDPAVDLNNRSIRYLAVCNNADGTLLPGSFAQVEINILHHKDALFIPTESVIPVLKGKKVFVVKNGMAEERMIETGIRTEENIQVFKGLTVGDSVVLNGNTQLKKGAPVICNTEEGKRKK